MVVVIYLRQCETKENNTTKLEKSNSRTVIWMEGGSNVVFFLRNALACERGHQPAPEREREHQYSCTNLIVVGARSAS